MKKSNEKKKNGKAALYVTAAAALALVAAITLTVIFATGANNQAKVPDDSKKSESNITDNSGKTPDDDKKPDDSGNTPDDSGDKKPEENPVDTKIIFAVPVEGGTCIKEYTQSSVTYNKTLGIYTGHLGMDFAAEGEAAVVAVYDGTIISVTESVLEGKTIKIDHGNGLISVYNSLEPTDDAIVGKTVKKGDKIGVISENNRQEYKDGAHLHFEVYENGNKVSPVKYLEGVEK